MDKKHTHTLLKVLTSCLGLALVTSCSTLSKEECLLGNWQSIGYQDGVSGHTSSYISNHQKACAKASVSPNYKAWEEGRKEGLKRYCTKSNAFNLGKQGKSLSNVCPIAISNQLHKINDQGKSQYTLNKQLKDNRKKYQKYEEELEKLRNGEMLDFKSEKEARKYMLSLSEKMDKLEKDKQTMEKSLQSLLLISYD